MPTRNTPQKILESWKQIAGYLDRSERTVRRWEASEGLPVHRREHEKQDTVFAFRHEIEAWSRLHTKYPHEIAIDKAQTSRCSSRPLTPILSSMTRSPARCIAISRALGRATEISCARLFILPPPSPATVKGLNIVGRLNTSSSGSLRTARHPISVLASRESRSSRASRSFIWRFNTGQVSWLVRKHMLRTYSPCSSGMASGRSRISSSTGMIDNSTLPA